MPQVTLHVPYKPYVISRTWQAIAMVADDDLALAELCLSERAAAAASDAWQPW